MLSRWWQSRVEPRVRGGFEGIAAERLAAAWLVRHRDLAVITRNWRNPADRREEIDLVLRDGAHLVFVEVKARGIHALVPGLHSVGARKRSVLRRAVRAYLRAAGAEGRPFRFDIVEVETVADQPSEGWTVRHYRGVPLFDRRVLR